MCNDQQMNQSVKNILIIFLEYTKYLCFYWKNLYFILKVFFKFSIKLKKTIKGAHIYFYLTKVY